MLYEPYTDKIKTTLTCQIIRHINRMYHTKLETAMDASSLLTFRVTRLTT